MKQVQLHCRVCGQRLTKVKTKSIAFQCKAIADKLQTAFGIDTSGDDLHIHPESMCKCCKLSMDRVISAMKNKVHHRSAVVLFQWEKHCNQECKVKGVHGEQSLKMHLYRCVSTFMPVQKVAILKGPDQLLAEAASQV